MSVRWIRVVAESTPVREVQLVDDSIDAAFGIPEFLNVVDAAVYDIYVNARARVLDGLLASAKVS